MIIYSLTKKMYEAINVCKHLDLAKAFDTVDHTQLLETVWNAEKHGITLNLFKSYLFE